MLELPIGYDNFQKVIENGLDYVDKSLFIQEVLENKKVEVMVITRPRRFGKTLNLSMLHHFLAENVNGHPTQGLFDTLKIAQAGETYMRHQGQYPVVALTFKEIKSLNFENAFSKIYELIIEAYHQHLYLETSPALTHIQKEFYKNILQRKATLTELEMALKLLMECLYIHHGVKPWLLIDEYDTPILAGYMEGYYGEMVSFMRGLLGSALKSNPYLSKAVITGILRVAKESLFSGLNNVKVYSLLSTPFSTHFGFTESEVDAILRASHLVEHAAHIKDWYNGYQCGDTTLYNPWSIANCVDQHGKTQPYWVNTSDNQLIKEIVQQAPLTFKQEFESLIQGQPVEKWIDESLAFQYLSQSTASLWSLLFMAGYLKPISSRDTDQGLFVTLAIPNREVRNLYRQIIEQWLSQAYGIEWYNRFIASLLEGKLDIFQAYLEKVLLQIVSVHDVGKEPEAFYHGLVLGFMSSLHYTHEVKSNRESGLGRYDIVLIPKNLQQSGIILELKLQEKGETLQACAQRALSQIEHKHYSEDLKQRGITHILQVGIGFKGKKCTLAYTSSQ